MGCTACVRPRVVVRVEGQRIRVNVLTPGQVVTPRQEQMFDDETKAREALIHGKERQP